MNSIARKSIATVFAGTVLAVGVASPASAATKQDGLVNVEVGDVTILEDVNIAAAVEVVAQLCGIDLDVLANVAVLSDAAQTVDNTSRSYTVCKTDDGKVKITQN